MNTAQPERHLDPDALGSPLNKLPELGVGHHSVAVVIADDAARTPRGQLLSWAIVNQLLRCYGAINEVTVACPNTQLAIDLPAIGDQPRHSGDLPSALAGLGVALADPNRAHPRLTMSSNVTTAVDQATVVLVVADGVSTLASLTVTAPAFLVTASAWKAAVLAADALPTLAATTLPNLDAAGPVMVGAWFASAIAVSEAFKVISAMRPGAGTHINVFTADLFAGVAGPGLDALALPDGPTDPLAMPAHWLAGAGAVGQVYLAVLATSQVNTTVATIDYDILDDGNLNRHILCGRSDVGAAKAHLPADRLAGPTNVVPLPYRWQEWVSMHPTDRPPLPAELAAQAATGTYELVICALDKNPARMALSAARPQLIIGASSHGLTVEVGRYGRDSPWQCLGCANPVSAARTVEQAAAEAAAMSDTELERAAARAGVDPAVLREYVINPACGTLGAREMEKFAASAAPDWSVSFASVAAGTLAAARALAHVHHDGGLDADGRIGQLYCEEGDTVRVYLLHAQATRAEHARRSECPICHGHPDVRAAADSPTAPSRHLPGEPALPTCTPTMTT